MPRIVGIAAGCYNIMNYRLEMDISFLQDLNLFTGFESGSVGDPDPELEPNLEGFETFGLRKFNYFMDNFAPGVIFCSDLE